jgi:hypothetical protein
VLKTIRKTTYVNLILASLHREFVDASDFSSTRVNADMGNCATFDRDQFYMT